ncbi:unnamed protein product [marine sediment metagenome]|uniref:Uncharacterized protein n=1 Tax=marine sediment metagenome TaxID=412755 RepID=X1E9X7_9ZZZZ
MRFADEVSNRPEYIYKYRYAYAYGAFHGFSMVSCGSIAHNHTSAIFIVGAREPGYARGMGCIPRDNFKDSLEAAEKYVGKNPRTLVLPGVFTKPGFHTFRK